MRFRTLNRANFKVSEIGFGCMSLGQDHKENARLIHEAIGLGINFFDTADLYQYGLNESSLGRALEGNREGVIIASKVGNEWSRDKKSWRWNPSKSYILKAVDKSLERLRTDYIDIYQLHGGTIEDPMGEVVEAFDILIEKGKIRSFGLSSIRPNVIAKYIGQSGLVSNMLQYSLLDRRPEEELLTLLKDNAVGVIARGTLAKGKLLKNSRSIYLGYESESIDLMVDKVNSFSNEKITSSQICIQWVLANPAVTSALIGFRTLEQLREAVGVSLLNPIDAQTYNDLAQVLPLNYYQEHRT